MAKIDEIDKRLNTVEHSISRFMGGLKVAGIVMVLIVLPLCGWAIYSIHALSISVAIMDAKIDAKVSALDSKLSDLSNQVTKLSLRQSSGNPIDPLSIKDAINVLDTAKSKGIKLPVDVVQEAGIKFVEVAEKNPQVWPVAGQFFSYRSFLNVDFLPALTPATGKSKYQSSVTIHLDPQHPEWHSPFEVLFAGGYASSDKAARLESLSHPQPEPSEFSFFIINGGHDVIVLDGELMKNVIIRNADVEYSGGPVVLENVYFVNCTFVSFRLTPKGVDLGKTLLASASATFTVSKKSS